VKLAVVVQRYGPAIHGGAESHARYVAEHLAQHTDVDVLTTCAKSNTTWANEFDAGTEPLNGVQVRRFRVSSPDSASTFSRLSDRVFTQTHSIADELRWLQACAPMSRPLVRYLRKNIESYDFCIFVGYRSGLTYYGLQAAGSRTILVPRSESDPSLGASIFSDLFQNARAILFDSREEQSLVQAVCGAAATPSAVIGAGVDVPQNPQPARFRQKRNIRGPFAMYVGPTDAGSCADLLALFDSYSKTPGARLSLVFAGEGPSPKHPKTKHVGVLDDAEKFDAIAAADVVIVPSRHRSFSRTAIEAWSLGTAVLANGASKALRGLCVGSNGGLCYCSAEEFVGMLQAIEQNRWLSASLGRNGRQYVHDHFDWRVVGRKYHEMLEQLRKSPAPGTKLTTRGWLARRRRDLSPSAEMVRSIA
jgi:glycosyltransferase involved in cell wall biosynthesis